MENTENHKISKAQIAIIGGGFGGIAMAIRLLQNGIQDFTILEKANDFGGTWRDNRYPGAACDVQSHMYSLSFAPKTDWTKRYAEAPEIFDYIQGLIAKFKLAQYARLQCEVLSAVYLEDECQWQLTLNDQSTLIAQYVIFASGPQIGRAHV